MNFGEVETPEQLMIYLDKNFKYGVIDNCGNRYLDSDSSEFQFICNTQWKLRSVKEILAGGIGHCYDQIEIERNWFTQNGYDIKTFWISVYQNEVDNSGFSHAYLIFKENETWKLFEHADFFNKGIHEFQSVRDAVNWQTAKQIKFAEKHIKPVKQYSVCIKEYDAPPMNIDMQEYLHFVNNSKDYDL